MAWPSIFESGRLLLLLPLLIGGMAAEEGFAQTIRTKLKSVMVLEHGTGAGHRASSDDFNAALRDLGATHGFAVKVLAQDAKLDIEFSAANLANYQVVILSNNDGVHRYIEGAARTNFQTYVENGGGLQANHAASAFITGWPWIDSVLVEKFYGPHQTNGPAADLLQDPEGLQAGTETRGITKDLTAPKGFIDSYYQFQSNPRGKLGATILLTVDERSSSAPFFSPMGQDHPVAWARTVGKGRVVHTCLGHSFGQRGHNAYTQKGNYLKNFIYTSLRYAAGDFLGCMDSRYEEYNPDATKNDSTQCKTLVPTKVAFNSAGNPDRLPLISRNESGSLLQVEFLQEGRNTLTITDITGKEVYRKSGSGQTRFSVPVPEKSGIYIVKALAGGKTSTHRVTVL